MTCDRIRPLLSAYHDDALSPEDRARVRRHVAVCPACAETLATYGRVYAALQQTAVAVPPELRRNVYARIAEIEARRGALLPFGPALLGALRTAGGTAGLLAVLGALIAAAVRLGGPQPATGVAAMSPAEQRVAVTAVAGMVGAAASTGSFKRLPDAVQTAAAPVYETLKAGGAVRLGHAQAKDAGLTVEGSLLRVAHSRAPSAVVPFSLRMSMAAQTPVVSAGAYGTPSPVPTVPATDGAVYLRLGNACVFIANCGNSPAEIAYHAFVSAQQPRVLVTPAPWPAQLFTGLNASLDGRRIAYSAMSPLDRYSGIFELDTGALAPPAPPAPQHIVHFQDVRPANAGGWHRYVKQVYAAPDGRLFFALVEGDTASIAITTTRAVMPLKAIDQPTFDYVMSPDQRRVIWTARRRRFFGRLQVADVAAHPVTRTITEIGSRPVWSPDGQHVLFLDRASYGSPAGLALWSAQTGAVAQLVAPPADSSFISGYAWAPNGRFFLYVLTMLGNQDVSRVWLGDTQTGYTWPVFKDGLIGTIAWVHGGALNTLPAAPGVKAALFPAAPAANPKPAPAGVGASAMATAGPPSAAATSAPAGRVTSAGGATPLDALRSFYNAVGRHDFARAYSYLSAWDGRTLAQFAKGYADTQAVSIQSLQPARYLNAASFRATTCVGVALTARHRDGRSLRYGGWYLLESTTGQNPRFGGWRIVIRGSHVTAGGRAVVPPQSRCAAGLRLAA